MNDNERKNSRWRLFLVFELILIYLFLSVSNAWSTCLNPGNVNLPEWGQNASVYYDFDGGQSVSTEDDQIVSALNEWNNSNALNCSNVVFTGTNLPAFPQ